MTKSVYILGGAGSGKSTFMAELLERNGHLMSDQLIDLHQTPNARGTVVTLRGHELAHGWSSAGLYLGCMREFFPGTDGLDRASSIAGEAWLRAGGAAEYKYIVAEGATLATSRFMTALHEHTDLLIIFLNADEMIVDLRFLQRGSNQNPGFVKNTVTRSRNLALAMTQLGAKVWEVDSTAVPEWEEAMEIAVNHLQ